MISQGFLMKGPSGKSLYRIERRWKCSQCGKELATGGDVVVRPCPSCSPRADGAPIWMSLVESRRRRNPFPFGTSHGEG
jgi:predicted RNA-binding Zn-ribbon protein involved in translation (DUF1610 family)